MKVINPRSITDAERPWLEAWAPDAQLVLLRSLRDHGHSNPVAFGVLGMLTAKALGELDGLSMSARAKYRAALRDLAAAGVTPPPNRRSAPYLKLIAGGMPAARRSRRRSTGGTAARITEIPSLLSAVAGVGLALAVLAADNVRDGQVAVEIGSDGRIGLAWDVPETSLAA